jgi:hypothetical protein
MVLHDTTVLKEYETKEKKQQQQQK